LKISQNVKLDGLADAASCRKAAAGKMKSELYRQHQTAFADQPAEHFTFPAARPPPARRLPAMPHICGVGI
jgi:hypothetical protein